MAFDISDNKRLVELTKLRLDLMNNIGDIHRAGKKGNYFKILEFSAYNIHIETQSGGCFSSTINNFLTKYIENKYYRIEDDAEIAKVLLTWNEAF